MQNRNARRRAPQTVPIELAYQLVAERDQLALELENAQTENSQLRDALRLAHQESAAPTPVVSSETLERTVAQLTQDITRIRSRTEIELSRARTHERAKLLSGLGEVMDSVDRALRTPEVDSVWRQGIEAIRTQLLGFLESEQAQVTAQVGEQADPRLHEAVAELEVAGVPRGEIVHVERHGIVLEDGSVARTAQVILAK